MQERVNVDNAVNPQLFLFCLTFHVKIINLNTWYKEGIHAFVIAVYKRKSKYHNYVVIYISSITAGGCLQDTVWSELLIK
jgi:hypothetical protein